MKKQCLLPAKSLPEDVATELEDVVEEQRADGRSLPEDVATELEEACDAQIQYFSKSYGVVALGEVDKKSFLAISDRGAVAAAIALDAAAAAWRAAEFAAAQSQSSLFPSEMLEMTAETNLRIQLVERMGSCLHTLQICLKGKRNLIMLENLTMERETMPFQRAGLVQWWVQDAVEHLDEIFVPIQDNHDIAQLDAYPLRGHQSAAALVYALGKIIGYSMFSNKISPMGASADDLQPTVACAALAVAKDALLRMQDEMRTHLDFIGGSNWHHCVPAHECLFCNCFCRWRIRKLAVNAAAI